MRKNKNILRKEKVIEYLQKNIGFEKILNIFRGSDFMDIVVLRGGDPITYRVRLIDGDFWIAVR